MNTRQSRLLTAVADHPVISGIGLLGVLLVAVAVAINEGKRAGVRHIRTVADGHGAIHQHHLQLLLEKYSLVPALVAKAGSVQHALIQPSAQNAVITNRYLEQLFSDSEPVTTYVMDMSGNTLAASNWRTPGSFVGHNYGFRPYFLQARSGNSGRYIALGVTSNVLGYYVAEPVLNGSDIVGVAAVKVSLGGTEREVKERWQRESYLTLMTDENGVIFVAPLDDWKYKATLPLSNGARERIETSHQYAKQNIVPLSMRQGEFLDHELRFVQFDDIPGQTFVHKSLDFPELAGRINIYEPASEYWGIVKAYAAAAASVALAVLLASITAVQRWSYRAKLMQAAIHDPLTGLYTRLYMNEWADALLRAHERDQGAGFALVLFDLDHFKQINDRYGHLAGDSVLGGVASTVLGSIRGDDIAVRYGGEELAVFVRCPEISHAIALADRIRKEVAASSYQTDAGAVSVTTSGGIAHHESGESLDALFARADKKLYQAKTGGRNQVCV